MFKTKAILLLPTLIGSGVGVSVRYTSYGFSYQNKQDKKNQLLNSAFNGAMMGNVVALTGAYIILGSVI